MASKALPLCDGMGSVARLFHNHASKPITVLEFHDALQSVCRPRFPNARSMRPRNLGMAKIASRDCASVAC